MAKPQETEKYKRLKQDEQQKGKLQLNLSLKVIKEQLIEAILRIRHNMAETFRVFLTSLQIDLCTKMEVLLARLMSTFQLIPTHQILSEFWTVFAQVDVAFYCC